MKLNLFIASFVRTDNTGGSVGMDYIMQHIGKEKVWWYNLKSRLGGSLDCYSEKKIGFDAYIVLLLGLIEHIFSRFVFTSHFNRFLHSHIVDIYQKFISVYAFFIGRTLKAYSFKNVYLSLDNDFVFQVYALLPYLKSAKVHCIVSDDPVGTLVMYGNRNSIVLKIDELVRQILQKVDKVYVISEGMRTHYFNYYSVSSIVTLPVNFTKQVNKVNDVSMTERRKKLRFIHVGHLRKSEISNLNNLLSRLDSDGFNYEYIFVGRNSSYYKGVFRNENLVFYEWVDQDVLNQLLDTSSFGYLPYSFEKSDELFVKTSFPNKLTSYAKRGLPTLYHGPEYASVCTFIERESIGIAFKHCNIETFEISLLESQNVNIEEIISVAKLHFDPSIISECYDCE